MNPNAIRQLQLNLKISPTGVFDSATVAAMNKAVSKAAASNPDIARYAGTNGVDAILGAYMSGDYSNLISLTGKPFTRQQQEAAVKESERALAPAFKAQEALDRSVVDDTLRGEAEDFGQFQKAEADTFKDTKNELDQSAADQGVLFSGSRFQKLNDLRTTYADREAIRRGQGADRIRSAARGYQYDYGNDAADSLSSRYRLPGTSTFNANVAGGQVTPGRSLSSVYNPSEFKFQGTKPVAQKAAVQTRAASLLTNRANKLTATGYNNKL